MKSTGIIRRIDELGRVVIPKEIRRTLHIKEGDPLELYLDGTTLCLKKYNTTELFSEALDDMIEMVKDAELSSCLSVEDKALICSVVNLLKAKWKEKQDDESRTD